VTTTNNSNNSKLQAPPALMPASVEKSLGLVTGYFRQSADNGVNFTVTPVYMHPADLAQAIAANPWEYALTSGGFAAWKGGYNNSAASVGGRGRLQGSPVIAE